MAVGVIGLLGAQGAMTLSSIPPKQISTGSPAIYVGGLLGGAVQFVAISFVLFMLADATRPVSERSSGS